MTFDSKLWMNRWDSLSTGLKALQAQLPAMRDRDLILFMLTRLNEFTNAKFKYHLTAGLSDDPSKPPAKVIPQAALDRFSRDYALRLTLDQFAQDVRAISQAASQRSLNLNLATGPSQIDSAFQVAECIALECLQLAKDAGLINRIPTPLIYFQKSPSIRVIPYADVALIAIPYTCAAGQAFGAGSLPSVGTPRDFLAIPHEVGHYVFWHGTDVQNQGKRMSTVMHQMAANTNQKWDDRWIEEMFADTFGCRAAGPAIALDFQDLVLEDSTRADFFDDQDRHPMPFLRPNVYLKTLTEMHLSTWANNLQLNWSTHPFVVSAVGADRTAAEQRIGGLTTLTGKLNDLFDGNVVTWPSRLLAADLFPSTNAMTAQDLAAVLNNDQLPCPLQSKICKGHRLRSL